jgi:hypothetical protein
MHHRIEDVMCCLVMLSTELSCEPACSCAQVLATDDLEKSRVAAQAAAEEGEVPAAQQAAPPAAAAAQPQQPPAQPVASTAAPAAPPWPALPSGPPVQPGQGCLGSWQNPPLLTRRLSDACWGRRQKSDLAGVCCRCGSVRTAAGVPSAAAGCLSRAAAGADRPSCASCWAAPATTPGCPGGAPARTAGRAHLTAAAPAAPELPGPPAQRTLRAPVCYSGGHTSLPDVLPLLAEQCHLCVLCADPAPFVPTAGGSVRLCGFASCVC